MKMSLKPLYLPLLIAVILAGIGVGIVMVSQRYLERTRAEHRTALAERQAIQAKLSQATEEEREIREKLVDYRKLLARGVIGDERRLEWVETVGQIKNDHKLLEIKYQIEPQRLLDFPGIVRSPGIEFRASALKIDMQLLHEGDLLVFINELRRRLNAYVLVRSCSINRLGRPSEERGINPRLRAECTIDLVTIHDNQLKST